KEKNIKKITIESRPEYISIEKIEQLIDILREDQKLNIAFGLETRDVFIQNFCINKGYGTKEFEKIVEMIFNINKKCANKICVFVYGLIKPAYLEEKEAIQDMVRAGVYINKLSKKYPFDIYMKLEPCVVPDGTLLEILFDEKTSSGERKYTPPSYWSVVEIIARLEKANAVTKLRIGSREDMDAFKAIPAVYYDIGMMSNYDFIIYEAVQRYNYHRNIVQLLLDIEIAFNDKTLQEWKNKVKIQHPCFLSLHKKYKSKMNILKKTAEYSQRMKFLDNLFEALDIIEYSEQIQRKAKNIWAKNIEESKKDIKKTIEKIISSYLPNTKTNIEHIELLNYDLKLLRMQIQIQHENKNYGVWVGIPTARRVNIQEVK
ncbi:MAG: hypothetical protein KAI55_01485, partial [Candidatus Aenigmarchaeota archaeon]|nr:hypothetical protein [Candidatus Aenigmarchaeota archaeon]